MKVQHPVADSVALAVAFTATWSRARPSLKCCLPGPEMAFTGKEDICHKMLFFLPSLLSVSVIRCCNPASLWEELGELHMGPSFSQVDEGFRYYKVA